MTFKSIIRIISNNYLIYMRNIEEIFRYITHNSIFNIIKDISVTKGNISINQREIRLSPRNQIYE